MTIRSQEPLTTSPVSELPDGLSGLSCVGLVSISVYALAILAGRASSMSTAGSSVGPTSGRGDLRTRGSILCSMGKDRPRNTCMLCSERYGGDVHVPTLFEP